MTELRKFHIGDIISITDGHLVSPRHITGVYDILGWMTGENLMTHQLPRALNTCKEPLYEQHPDIASIVVPDFTEVQNRIATILEWLQEQVDQYGETRMVAPLNPKDQVQVDPLEELFKMVMPDES